MFNPNNFAYWNGQVLPQKDLHLPLQDLGLLRAWAVFDYARSFRGRPFHLEDHFHRFERSAQALGLGLSLRWEEMEAIVDELMYLREKSTAEVGIRFLLSGGSSMDGSSPGLENLWVFIEDQNYASMPEAQSPIKVLSHNYLREMPLIKNTNYGQMYIRRAEMKQKGAADLLYYQDGEVSECTRNNFFIVKGDTIISNDRGILEGITREVFLKLIPNYFKLELRPFSLEEAKSADEAFKTGTTNVLTPIIQIDDQVIGSGAPGPVAKKLWNAFYEYVETYLKA